MADITQVSGDAPRTAVGDSEDKVFGPSPRAFKTRVELCKTKRRELVRNWQINVDMRRMKAMDTDSDENSIPLPIDWANTNAKVAQLFSQMPEIIVTGEGPYAAAAAPVQKWLNRMLRKAGISATMNEVMPDAINAAGIGVAYIGYEQRTITKRVPETLPEDLGIVDSFLVKTGLKQIPMIDQEQVVDRMFSIDRVSPGDFLWDTAFQRSDFNASPWIGKSGRMPWAEALVELGQSEARPNGLVAEDRDKVLGDNRTQMDRLDADGRTQFNRDDEVVSFDEIFYWRHLYHEDEKYFAAIQRMVFVDGKKEPVINEPWEGQRFDKEIGKYIGSCKFPIQVLTLNYVSDDCIPPSDTGITRRDIRDLIRDREHIFSQRDHSMPVRWGNTDRIDADVLTLLMQGDWQGIIPTQGDGSKILGEIARANYPQENHELAMRIERDIDKSWGLSANQGGSMMSGPRSAAEAKIVQGNFGVGMTKQRSRTTEFVINIADVLLGLMALYDDFELPDQADGQALQMWDRTRISHEMAFSIISDSTVLLDAEQMINRKSRFLNIAGKSGRIDAGPILEDLALLSGITQKVVMPPPTPKPDQANISLRLTGKDDMNDPMVVGMLIKNQQMAGPDDIAAAQKLLASVHPVNQPVQPTGQPPQVDHTMTDAHPNWASVDRINSRRDASQE